MRFWGQREYTYDHQDKIIAVEHVPLPKPDLDQLRKFLVLFEDKPDPIGSLQSEAPADPEAAAGAAPDPKRAKTS